MEAPELLSSSSSSSENSGLLGTGSSIPPSQTLYIQNLSEKVKKAPMKKALYGAFSPFGKVLDIVHIRSDTLRGQAWVVFGDVASSTTAMAQMQSFHLFDKPMRVSFAKEKSHAAAKVEGTYTSAMKRGPQDTKVRSSKRQRTETNTSSSSLGVEVKGGGQQPPSLPKNNLPSKTLLVQGLPTTLTGESLTDMLKSLFGQYAGLVDVKVVAQRGLAFVEFTNESAAAPALQGLQNFKLDATNTLLVSYARAF